MTGLLASASSAADKRAAFRAGLNSGRLQRFPGAFSPLVAKLVAEIGFEGVYVSGAVLSADLGLPDIGLTTLTEVTGRGAQIASVTDLPTLIDADTGFGEPMSAARTITLLEDAGLAGCHLEDQVNPKRCGHLDGKAVVPTADMVKRLRAAVAARRDPNFVICARTDAAGIEGIDAAIDRARAYADAGADLIVMHGAPLLHGVEIYRDRPIFFDLGNFIFQTALANVWEPNAWESVVAYVDFEANTLKSIKFRPIAVNKVGESQINTPGTHANNLLLQTSGLPRVATGEQAYAILQRLADLSRPFGTNVEINGEMAAVKLKAGN